VRRAFFEMASGRPRPTEIEIPPETFLESEEVTLLGRADVAPVAADPELVERAADLLAASKSPVVIAGGGVVLGNATQGLAAVVELLSSPVLTTREGKGAIDDRNPLSVGTAWVNRRVQPLIDGADVVLAVGTRGQGMGLTKGQRLIHLDVDQDQIGRNHPAEIALAGDAAATLSLLEAALAERVGQRPSRAEEAQALRRSVGDQLRAIGPAAHMVELLRSGVPEDGILVCDTTTVAYMCHMHYPVYAPRTYLSTSYMGTLGFGYPASLGVKVARPDNPVVTVTGDGGFLFAATELATAVQHGIHTVTIVFDDGAYGNSNRDQREKYHGRELGTVLRNPDWVAFARSFGAEGTKVDDVEKLPAVLADAIAASTETSTVIAVPMDRLPSPF